MDRALVSHLVLAHSLVNHLVLARHLAFALKIATKTLWMFWILEKREMLKDRLVKGPVSHICQGKWTFMSLSQRNSVSLEGWQVSLLQRGSKLLSSFG